MRNIFLMTIRDLKTYFMSITGYVILSIFLLIYGYVFWFLVSIYSSPQYNLNEPITNFFFGSFYYWFVMLIIPPILTMRSIAEERKTGTLELLITAPVSEMQIIVAKFLSSFIFYAFMWIITLFYFFLISKNMPLEWLNIINGYLGTFLAGSVFISLGILSSTISRNQIVAAIVSFGFGLLIFSASFVSYLINYASIKPFMEYINIMDNTMKFSQGIFDTRPVIYFISLTIGFLFISVKILDSQRWR